MDVPEPLREPIRLTVVCARLAGAVIWKSVGLGYGWTSGLFATLGLLAFYAVLWLVDRWGDAVDPPKTRPRPTSTRPADHYSLCL